MNKIRTVKNSFLILLIICIQGNNTLFAQFGPELFVAPDIVEPSQISLVDFDGDGYDDVLASSTITMGWFRNLSGTGEFSEFKTINSQRDFGRYPCTFDWDGDGDLDIFTASDNLDKVFYYENLSGEGEFSTPRTIIQFNFVNASDIRIADLENDGDNDIFIYSNSRAIRLFRNTGQDFAFEAPIMIGNDNDVTVFTIGDIDNDQDIDLVYQESTFLVVRRYNQATGAFWGPEYANVANQSTIRGLGLAHFNGDGMLDLYLSDDYGNVLAYLNNGFGVFNNYEVVRDGTGGSSKHLSVADMDADGDQDLLFHNNESEIFWFQNIDGTGVFADELLIWQDYYGRHAFAGRINNDSYPDVIALYINPAVYSKIIWFEGTAIQTNLEEHILYFEEEIFDDWAVADINNDAKVDLVLCSYDYFSPLSYNTRSVYIFLRDSQEYSYHYPIDIPSAMEHISLVDLDEDGDIDIVGNNYDDSWLGWLENDHLNFTTHALDASFFNSSSLDYRPAKPVDIDFDGDLDILLFADDKIAWYENLGNAQNWGPLIYLYQNLQQSSFTDILPIDIDADNDMDFVASLNDKLMFIIKSNSTNSYDYIIRYLYANDQVYYPRFLTNADADSDGDMDIFFSAGNKKLYWLENDQIDFTLSALHLVADDFEVQFKAFYMEDFNNDGFQDVLWSDVDETTILQNDGSGNFTTYYDSETGYRHTIPFDIDLDGDLDLVFATGASFFIRKNYSNNARIKGIVYWDENQNSQFDSLEIGLSQHQVLIEPTGLRTPSSVQGNYEFAVEANTYELRCIPADLWTLTTDSVVTITIPDTSSDVLSANFGVTFNSDSITAQINLASAPTRCGFEVPFWINYHADNHKRSDGYIFLHLNPLADFLSANPMPSTVTDTLLTWNFSDASPLEMNTIGLKFRIAGVQENGSDIDMVAMMDIIEADTIVARDTFLYHSNITCSYDPNDKQVSPSIPGYPNYTLFGEELNYTIRFENTGLDTAFNIFIEDQLDQDLNWASFRLIGSSHPVRITRSEAGLLTFYFDDILLPYTGIDPLGSQGFVSYAIKPLDSLELNEYILNDARIFFDFNPPIITNRVSNIFVDEYPVHFDLVQPSCFESLDGQIIPDFLSSGFLYYWNNSPDEPVIDSIGSGTYAFSLYRYDGTLVNASAITLDAPSELLIELSSTPETDFQENGTASVEITGGVPPYSIQWSTDPIAEGETIEGLSSGMYEVTVTDANGCEQVGNVFLDLIVQIDSPIDEAGAFSFFPNPADNQLWVSSASPQAANIFIYNLNGQLIKNETVYIANKYAIDVETLPSAIYLIKIIKQGNPVLTRRFTVVHSR